ncbi:MAG: HD domain-containing phosphohydrolase [Arcobacteraceae bacterium]
MQSIKSIVTKRFGVIFALLSFVVILAVTLGFRQISIENAKDKSIAMAEIIKAGLTAHMKSGIMDKRDYFLNEIKSTYNVNSINIIRSEAVNKQFGSSSLEKNIDEYSRYVFETKEPFFNLNEDQNKVSLQSYIPYIASNQNTLKCLECHNVSEGTVLGVVEIDIDLSQYKALSLTYIVAIILFLIFFIIFTLLKSIKTINEHVIKPLESLIDKFEHSVLNHTKIDSTHFETKELIKTVEEVNQLIDLIHNKNQELEIKNIELKELNLEIEETLKETLTSIGMIAEHRSKETANHVKRVGEISKLIANKLGFGDDEAELMYIASQLHDIGKIAIADELLLKNGKLTPEEYTKIQFHAQIGYEMLRYSERKILKASSIIALEHHEKYDGTGYPNGKKGENIHIYGRIVAVCDVLDALSSKRCYKEAWPFDEVMDYIKGQSGLHFDPVIVNIVLECKEEIKQIMIDFRD